MNAAEMFVAQAKGELGSANPGEREKERQRKEITITPASTFSDVQHQVTLQHPLAAVRPSQGSSDMDSIMHTPQLLRPLHEPRHHTFPVASSSSSSQNPYPSHLNTRPAHAMTFPMAPGQSSSSDHLGCTSTIDASQGKTKVFVCPLYSCCRFFKRMEHLKRHLRTHTLERPYQCKRCSKRFSRSDNLNQHLRTHTRADSEGGNTGGYDDEQADAESEDMDELDGDEAYNTTTYPNGVRNLQTPDIKMCEMEVSGNVQEVHGDEEGLVAAPGADFTHGGQDAFFASHLDPYGNSHLPSGAQWAGALNAPSPQIQMAQVHAQRSHTPLNSSPAGYMRQSSALYASDPEYVTSISAPSHKQMFDHSSLYPPHLSVMETSSGAAGPIRRHRSMTPSLIRGENIRRPMTASTDFGSPGRGYHPYAVPISGYVSQSSASTQSSPASYHVPLDYASSQAGSMGSIGRPDSAHRSNSSGQQQQQQQQQLQDQMHQMLNLEQVDDSIFANNAASSSGQQTYDEMYRTESPLPFAAGGPSGSQFDKHMPGHEQGLYTPLPESQADQFVSHTVDAGYFSDISQPHHHVSM
jgi:transcription factor STE12